MSASVSVSVSVMVLDTVSCWLLIDFKFADSAGVGVGSCVVCSLLPVFFVLKCNIQDARSQSHS